MPEERDPELLDCKITLFSKTYLRGKNFSLDVSNTDTNETLSIKDLSKGNTKYDTICCINKYYILNSLLSIILIFFVVGFDNEQVSIQVNGGGNGTTLCCWGAYSETEFQGEVLNVRYDAYNKGIYNSAQDMGKLFKDATSIQLLDKNCSVPY